MKQKKNPHKKLRFSNVVLEMNENLTEKSVESASPVPSQSSISSRASSSLKSLQLVAKNYSYQKDYLKTRHCFKSNNKNVKIIQVSKNSNNYILKKMKKLSASANEIKLHWLSADCEKIVNICDLYEDKEYYYLIIEFMKGGNLSTMIIEKDIIFTEHDVALIMYQLCLAVKHLHSLRIAHLNLVPESVLFSEQTDELNLKLSDFSQAKIFNDEEERKKAFSYDIRCLGKIMSLLCANTDVTREAKNLMDEMCKCKRDDEFNIHSVIESIWIKRHVRSVSYTRQSSSTSDESQRLRKNSQLSCASFSSELNGNTNEYEDSLNKNTIKASSHHQTSNSRLQSTIERDLEKISIHHVTASQQDLKNESLGMSMRSIDRLDEESLNMPKMIKINSTSVSSQWTASRGNLTRTISATKKLSSIEIHDED